MGLSYGLARILAAPLRQTAAATKNIVDNDLACKIYSGALDDVGQIRLALHMRELEVNSVVARLDAAQRRAACRKTQVAGRGFRPGRVPQLPLDGQLHPVLPQRA